MFKATEHVLRIAIVVNNILKTLAEIIEKLCLKEKRP